MIIEHEGKRPHVDPSARVAPNATLCGDVCIGAGTSIGFGAVIVAESGPVTIGENCVVMDTAVLRGTRRAPLTLGDGVLVGPRACLTGCTIEDEAFLATGATVFNGARIGARSVVRINGIVHIRTVLPPDSTVPLAWIAIGDPAAILPPDRHDEIWAIQKQLDFPSYVFGMQRPEGHDGPLPPVARRYAPFLLRHRGDRTIEPRET